MFRLIYIPRTLLGNCMRVFSQQSELRHRVNTLAYMASAKQMQQKVEMPELAQHQDDGHSIVPETHPSHTLPDTSLGPLYSGDSSLDLQKEDPSLFNSVIEHRMSIPKALYRRPLPESCIAFATDEGKKIFMEALVSGHMNCYFRLASQFRTQDEPAYCGLATLIMVLNALEIDPGRVWKGPWKWYHEDMLDCCVPTELVRQQGITFDEFICIAYCNSLDTRAVRVDKGASLQDFRDLVVAMTKKEDRFLIVSYSRGMLGQTGDGHFAPVSGYHPGRDLVLILDTARFKYPPHWVPLQQLFESMKGLDSSTGLPRGYVELWPAMDGKALLLFKIAREFSVNARPNIVEHFQYFLSAWTRLLDQTSPAVPTANKDHIGGALQQVLSVVIRGLVEAAIELDKETFVLNTQEHISCSNAGGVQCAVDELLSSLESSAVFCTVQRLLSEMRATEVAKLQNVFGPWPLASETHSDLLGIATGDRFGCRGAKRTSSDLSGSSSPSSCCDLSKSLNLAHFITTFLLSWPYALSPVPEPHSITSASSVKLRAALRYFARQDLCRAKSEFLRDEMLTLERQLRKLTGYHAHSLGSNANICCEKNADKSCCDSKTDQQL